MLTDYEKFVLRGVIMGYKFPELAMIAGVSEHDVKQVYYDIWVKLGLGDVKVQPWMTTTTKEKVSTNNIENWGYISRYKDPAMQIV